jgi:hypothetical protein
MWNNGSYDPTDPDRPARTHRDTTNTVITQITKVRNLTNGTPSRFNLLAGDLCYAQAQGDIQPIINPDGPHGSQPSSRNTPKPAPPPRHPLRPGPRNSLSPGRQNLVNATSTPRRWRGTRPAGEMLLGR